VSFELTNSVFSKIIAKSEWSIFCKYIRFLLGHEFNQLWKWGVDGKKAENHCSRVYRICGTWIVLDNTYEENICTDMEEVKEEKRILRKGDLDYI
jgi:hypothetical protein